MERNRPFGGGGVREKGRRVSPKIVLESRKLTAGKHTGPVCDSEGTCVETVEPESVAGRGD